MAAARMAPLVLCLVLQLAAADAHRSRAAGVMRFMGKAKRGVPAAGGAVPGQEVISLQPRPVNSAARREALAQEREEEAIAMQQELVEAAARRARPGQEEVSMLTAFMTACTPAADWQALGLYYSFLRAKQPGRLVRIAACHAGEREPSFLVPTWVTTGVDYVDHITYPLFNKAWAIAEYMKQAAPPEEYILVLDSDMLIHRPFLPADFGVAPGVAASENMWYLEDLNDVLVPELRPDLPQRDDWDANPGPGRRADAVGEFYFLHRSDMEKVSQHWWYYTLPVLKLTLQDPRPWLRRNLTRGNAWYAEMHAYCLGAAVEGVRHLATNSSVFHVAYYHPHGAPKALHYAWAAEVAAHGWIFNKHNHTDFRADACPAQQADFGARGLFPHPPSPRRLTSQSGDYVRNLLNIEIVATLNAAFCELHHSKFCSGAYVAAECDKAARLMGEVEEAWQDLEAQQGDLTCMDALPDDECADVSACTGLHMRHGLLRREFCRRTCGYC